MNKILEKAMKFGAGAGALNWGFAEFIDMNLLEYVPEGIFSTLVVAFIAASGAFVLYWAWKKKI